MLSAGGVEACWLSEDGRGQKSTPLRLSFPLAALPHQVRYSTILLEGFPMGLRWLMSHAEPSSSGRRHKAPVAPHQACPPRRGDSRACSLFQQRESRGDQCTPPSPNAAGCCGCFNGLQVALMKEWKGVVSTTLHSAPSPVCSDASWELSGKADTWALPHTY